MSIGWRSFYQLILANLVILLIFLFKFNNLPPQIPLFYSKPPGEDRLVDAWFIIVLPVMMNLLFLLNKYFFLHYFKEDGFIQKIIYYLNLFLIISFTLIFAKIIFLIT